MASWQEIERIRKDADEARRIAKALLNYSVEPGALREWEENFLRNTSTSTAEELTTRWSERLLDVRDNVERITKYKGISISRLVHGCYEARLDLSDEDEEWIVERYESSRDSVRRKHLWRLLRLAAEIDLIEPHTIAWMRPRNDDY